MGSSLQPRHHLRHDDGRVDCLKLLGFCLQEKHASQQPMLASNVGCCSPGIQGSTMTSSSRGAQVLISQLYVQQELRRLRRHQRALLQFTNRVYHLQTSLAWVARQWWRIRAAATSGGIRCWNVWRGSPGVSRTWSSASLESSRW